MSCDFCQEFECYGSCREHGKYQEGRKAGYAAAIEDAKTAIKTLAKESEALSFQAPLVMALTKLGELSRGSR